MGREQAGIVLKPRLITKTPIIAHDLSLYATHLSSRLRQAAVVRVTSYRVEAWQRTRLFVNVNIQKRAMCAGIRTK
jgi:hypothetical protein